MSHLFGSRLECDNEIVLFHFAQYNLYFLVGKHVYIVKYKHHVADGFCNFWILCVELFKHAFLCSCPLD